MADLNLDLSGIKPLLGQLGLGQAPATTAPSVDQMKIPPMPPPLTAPQAGYSAWSADPAHQQTIANSLTMPGTPITPPNVPDASPLSSAPVPPPLKPYDPMANIKPLAMPSSVPSMPPPVLPNVQQAPPTMDADMAAHPDQYQHAQLAGQGWKGFLRYGIPAALISAGSGLSNMGHGDPTAGFKLLGDQSAIDRGVPAANAAQYDLRNVKPLKDAAALADTQSQTAERGATAAKNGQLAKDLAPVPLSKEQAAAINQPSLEGVGMTPRDYNRLVGLAGNNNTSDQNNQRTTSTSAANNANTNSTKKDIADNRDDRAKAIADASNRTKTLIQGMKDNTSRANNQNTNDHKGAGGKAADGNYKVPADVTKRAALASNVNENVDAAEKVIQKRPDIFGAAEGRYTNVQQMIGSNDPDIQEMGVRMHNIALASNGAHGVRSQQAIQKTEDELFNNFKTGPEGIGGAFKATRGSMQTFLNDEQNFSSTGKRTGGGITAPPTGGKSDSVSVQIPGQPPGTIHASQLAAFKARYPNAKVNQ